MHTTYLLSFTCPSVNETIGSPSDYNKI